MGVKVTNQIGAVVCRLAAVYLAVDAVKSLSFARFDSSFWSDPPTILMYLGLTVATPLIAAVVIWFGAEKLAQFESTDDSKPGDLSLSASDLFAVGVTLIGVYAVFFGIVSAFRIESMAAIERFSRAEEQQFSSTVSYTYWAARAGYLPQIFIGVLLILGRRRLSRILFKIRYGGRGG